MTDEGAKQAKQGGDAARAGTAGWLATPGIETKKYCGLVLVGLVVACWIVTSCILFYQNRRTS